MINSGKTQIYRTLGLSVIISANIFLFVPFAIYLGNIEEFVTPVGSLFRLLVIPALALIAILIIVGGMLNASTCRRYTTIIAATGLVLWIQGNILVWNYGLLDGSNIDWGISPWRGVIDSTVWMLLILSGFFFYRVTEKLYVQLVVMIFILQSIMLMVTISQNISSLRGKENSYASLESLQQMYRFSTKRNVLHIILDSFQTDIFKEIISDGRNGGIYQSALEGFTFYEDNIGGFPYTYFSLPAIVSGQTYHNDIPKSEFIKKVFGGKTILNSAYASGYQIDFATEALMLDMLTYGQYTNAYLVPSNYHVGNKMHALNESAKLLDLTLFRFAPHFLKPYIYNSHRWLVQNMVASEEYWNFFYFSHNAFLNYLTQNLKVDRQAPVYKFFHLMSPHAPMVVNDDCSYTGGQVQRNRITVLAQSRCTLGFVIALLDAMKKKGVYDDSFIILMADHGGHIPPENYAPATAENNKLGHVLNPWVVAMATPLMLIKTPHATGSLKISTAPASMLDTAATVDSVLALGGHFEGRSIPALTPVEQRERRFYHYEWRQEDYVTDYILPIQEFIINGSPYDGSAWQLGKEFTAPVDN